MKKIIFLILSTVVLFSGCSLYTVNSEDVTTDYYPPKKSADEVVYMENIDRPHVVIGYVSVTAERIQRVNDIIEQMKREAAILGGDAITNLKTDAGGTWKKLPAQNIIGNAYVRANTTVTVVVFK